MQRKHNIWSNWQRQSSQAARACLLLCTQLLRCRPWLCSCPVHFLGGIQYERVNCSKRPSRGSKGLWEKGGRCLARGLKERVVSTKTECSKEIFKVGVGQWQHQDNRTSLVLGPTKRSTTVSELDNWVVLPIQFLLLDLGEVLKWLHMATLALPASIVGFTTP